MKVDNYQLELFRTCPAKFYERIILGLVTGSSPATGFGLVVHTGLAQLFLGHSLAEAWQRMEEEWEGDPIDDVRNLANAKLMVEQWLKKWDQGWLTATYQGKPVVERSVAFPTGRFLPNGEEILYGGVLDALLVNPRGGVRPVDHKTTSQLGPTYFDQFTPNSQMTGYLWLAQQMFPESPVDGPLVNPLCLTRGGKITIERPYLLARTQSQIDQWLDDVEATCKKIHQAKESQIWERHANACIGRYGPCHYRFLHSLPDKDSEASFRESALSYKPWDFEEERV